MTVAPSHSHSPTATTRVRRRPARILALMVISIVGLATLPACGAGGGSEAAAVTATGDMLPVFDPAASDDPAVGMAAPRVMGVDFAGNPVVLGNGPALVVFVAHWCPHCQEELPILVDWKRNGGELPIVLVSTAEGTTRPNHPASAWIAREGWDGPVLRDDRASSALATFGMTAFPAFVAVDADGNVAGRATGPQPAEVLDAISDALMP